MKTYESLAYQVRKERVWADDQPRPRWREGNGPSGFTQCRWPRFVLTFLLAGFLSAQSLDAVPASALTMTPCLRLVAENQASIRPAASRQHRVIPGLPLLQWICRLQPVDPSTLGRVVVDQPLD